MKRFNPLLFAIAVLVVLALDFAAFDDITTGKEPNYTAETVIIIASIPSLVGIYFLAKS